MASLIKERSCDPRLPKNRQNLISLAVAGPLKASLVSVSRFLALSWAEVGGKSKYLTGNVPDWLTKWGFGPTISRDLAYKILGIDATSRLKASVNEGAYLRMYPTNTLFPPAAFSASMIRCAEGIDREIGFSMNTSFPACRAATQSVSWNSSAVIMNTISTSGLRMTSRGCIVLWGMRNFEAQWSTVCWETSEMETTVNLAGLAVSDREALGLTDGLVELGLVDG